MRIALLSFHNAANYGAALQAYALQAFLERRGYDCEYINYQNQHRKNAYSMSFLIKDSLSKGKFRSAIIYLLGSPFLNLRKRRFSKFYSGHLKTTKRVYETSEQAKALNSSFDVFVVGSDQVWNPTNNGHDTAYLLDFVSDEKRKISYSSSFGLEYIPREYEKLYGDLFKRFYSIGVREKRGKELVKMVSGCDATIVLDPVLLFKKEDWLHLVKNKNKTGNYIFFYTNRKNQMSSFLSSYGSVGKGKKCHILSRNTPLRSFIKSDQKVVYSMSPTDFINEINMAELVVSASFHCIAMAIVLHKPFVAILVGDEGKDERIISMLSLLGLSERIYHESMSREEIEKSIDYDSVEQKLNELRKHSSDYLLNSITNPS